MNCKRIIRNTIFVMIALFLVNMLSGCGNNDGSSILVMGSTALQPLAEQAAKQFTDKYPDFDIQVQGGGSGTGLTAVAGSAAQIGDSDIFAEEKKGIDSKSLEDHKVCVMGIAVIVNKNLNVDNLTEADLKDIFTGKITNWNKLGGDDKAIVIINRPASSGTRATFKKYALGGVDEVSGKILTEDSSGTVLRTVGDTDGAMSYVGLSYIKSAVGIKTLSIDGIQPTPENIANGSYKLWSYEHMYTKGPSSGLAKSFIDYVSGDEVKPLVKKLGYIPISEMKVSR